jgi:inositol transport system substrate-binding protein
MTKKEGIHSMTRLRKSMSLFVVLTMTLLLVLPAVSLAKSGSGIVIAACMQGNQSGFVRYMTSGMYEYQKNSAPDVKLEVVFADDDPAKQLSQVETFVAQKVNAIILNPVDKVLPASLSSPSTPPRIAPM